MHDLRRPTKARTTPHAAGPEAMPLTGMAALRQRAGNAAATRWVQRQTGALDEHYATRPTEHPEWETYQKLTQAAGIPKDEAEAAWQLLLGGVDSQPALNAEAAARTSDRQKQRGDPCDEYVVPRVRQAHDQASGARDAHHGPVGGRRRCQRVRALAGPHTAGGDPDRQGAQRPDAAPGLEADRADVERPVEGLREPRHRPRPHLRAGLRTGQHPHPPGGPRAPPGPAAEPGRGDDLASPVHRAGRADEGDLPPTADSSTTRSTTAATSA